MRSITFALVLTLMASAAMAQVPAPATNQPAPANQPAAPPAATGATGTTGATTVQAPAVVPPVVPPVTPPAATPVQPGAPGAAAPCPACSESVNAYWVAFGVITGLLGLAILGILVSLKNSGDWSLADALAEKSSDRKKMVAQPVAGEPLEKAMLVAEPAMVGSASRLFAMLGTLVLTVVMLGIGYAMIWSLFTRGTIPALEGIGPYLMGGAALFAPYAFNQLKEAFKPAQR